MTFDLTPRPVRDGSCRRAARFAVLLSLAAVFSAAGCWEEIRYQPSAAATATARDEPTERREAETADDEAAEATPAMPVEPAAEPSDDELFGGDAETSTPDEASAMAEEDSVAPVESPRGPEPAAPAVAPSLTDDLPFTETEPAVAPVTPQERLEAWQAASGWSLAVAVAAKGLPADRYAPFLTDAELAAHAIGVELPPIPEVAEGDESESVIVESLRAGGDVELVTSVGERLDGSAAASARLAIDTHFLLLTYSPETAGEAASSLAASAELAELPGRLWQPLVRLLTEGADFQAVRAAVFAMHKEVEGYFDEAAREGE